MTAPSLGRSASRLVDRLAARRRSVDIGLMTHIVLGYPSLGDSGRIVDAMVNAGVDVIEVQIPFSDPTADGPVITRACQSALDGGVRVKDAMAFVREMSSRHDTPFVFMTYANVPFSYRGGAEAGGGLRAFVRDAADAGAAGLIVPDLPPEATREGYAEACREAGIHPIYVTSPNSPDARLGLIAKSGSGLLYSTSRTGTTGRDVELAYRELGEFLARAKRLTGLPVAVGFSISKREHVEALRGHADLAVVGSHFIRVFEESGLSGLEAGLKDLAG